jgi:lipopolysaccharide export system permease protein
MKKIFTPRKLILYLVKQFSLSLLIFFLLFLSLILISNFIEEIIYFRTKELTGNFYLQTFAITLLKIPTLIINFLPFIFLFSGIFFFVKLKRDNETISLSLSGFSDNFVTLVPAIYSIILGIFVIIFLTPISSELLKYHEITKQKFSSNENLIIISNTGLWLKEKQNNQSVIIRADKIENENFDKLNNLSIYKFDKNNKFIERLDAKEAKIFKNYWIIFNAKKLKNNEIKFINKINFNTNINIDKLKNFFLNSNTFSIWNVSEELKKIQERGYYGQELIITLNKYLSLPLLLFCMVVISTFFTLKIDQKFNNFIYSFIGVLLGIFVYFLNDLSIAVGKSGKIPLVFSVWAPLIIIMIFSLYSLLRNND